MAENVTLARPYAQAVFELAVSGDELAAWSERLSLLRQVVEHPDMQALLGNPRVSAEQVLEVIIAACGEGLGDAGRNLVRLLSDNGRLEVVPEIVDEYEGMRADAERVIDVDVQSAVTLSEESKAALSKALSKRLQRQVKLRCEVDPALVGGAVIRAGDQVIDGSVRAQLQQLAYALSR